MSYTRTGAIIGVGSILAFSTTSGGTYTSLKELVKIPFPHAPAGKIKATNMQSPNLIQEYVPGFGDPADMSCEANYLATDMDLYQTNYRVPLFWKATLPDGSVFSWPGYISDIDGEADPEAKITTKFKIQITGTITWAGIS